MIKFSRQRRNPFLAPRERLHDDYFIMKKLDRRGKTLVDFERLKSSASASGPWEQNSGEHGARPTASTRTESLKRALWS